jgi:hypothetical protein
MITPINASRITREREVAGHRESVLQRDEGGPGGSHPQGSPSKRQCLWTRLELGRCRCAVNQSRPRATPSLERSRSNSPARRRSTSLGSERSWQRKSPAGTWARPAGNAEVAHDLHPLTRFLTPGAASRECEVAFFSSERKNKMETCSQCNQNTASPLLVEWSTPDTVEDPRCVAKTFCSWICAACWFCVQAGIEAPAPRN